MKTIEMKYDIGTKVWVVYIHQDEVSVYADTLAEFAVSDKKEFYITEVGYHKLTQDEVILYEDKNKLYNTICEKMNEILEKVVKYGNEN